MWEETSENIIDVEFFRCDFLAEIRWADRRLSFFFVQLELNFMDQFEILIQHD